jgi:predicted nucleic acid-binding protein
LDANVLIRFLRRDHEEHSLRAAKLIASANQGQVALEVSAVAVAEVFYTLKSVYAVARGRAAELLLLTFDSPAFVLPERRQVLGALSRVASRNVDFTDAYLAQGAAERNVAVASFDRDLDKFADMKRYEP